MIYLASTSPRRAALLTQLGINFTVLESEIDERYLDGETADDYCQRITIAKANQGWRHPKRLHDYPVLAADTIVIINDKILLKPKDKNEAKSMLQQLQNRQHQVLTVVAIKQADKIKVTSSHTQVTFAPMSSQEIVDYIDSGESMGRSGAYSIQGRMAEYIKHLTGSYTGVVGLPLYETSLLLKQF